MTQVDLAGQPAAGRPAAVRQEEGQAEEDQRDGQHRPEQDVEEALLPLAGGVARAPEADAAADREGRRQPRQEDLAHGAGRDRGQPHLPADGVRQGQHERQRRHQHGRHGEVERAAREPRAPLVHVEQRHDHQQAGHQGDAEGAHDVRRPHDDGQPAGVDQLGEAVDGVAQVPDGGAQTQQQQHRVAAPLAPAPQHQPRQHGVEHRADHVDDGGCDGAEAHGGAMVQTGGMRVNAGGAAKALFVVSLSR